MQPVRNRTLILNWIFIIGVLALALNDHYFKWRFANDITGKVSDFAGLLIFPMFLQFLFPRFRYAVLLTALIFTFWKLPVATGLITFVNQTTRLHLHRTVDYTDFVALIVLPLSGYCIRRIDRYQLFALPSTALTWLIAIPAGVLFMATTAPVSHYMQPGADIHIGISYQLKVTQAQALAVIKAAGFVVESDSTARRENRAQYFVIKNAILGNGKDTIEAIQFGFLHYGKDSLLMVNNIRIKDKRKLADQQTIKRYKKYYQQLIKSELVEIVK